MNTTSLDAWTEWLLSDAARHLRKTNTLAHEMRSRALQWQVGILVDCAVPGCTRDADAESVENFGQATCAHHQGRGCE